MSIAQTEQKILEELANIENNPPGKAEEELKQDSNKLVDTLMHEGNNDTFQQEPETVPDETPDQDEADKEEPEEGKEPEEITEENQEVEEDFKSPAKLRHKMKEEKEAREKSEKEVALLRERLARLEGRAEVQQPPVAQEAAEEVPDQELEPEQFAIYKTNKLEKEFQKLQSDNKRINAERQWDQMQAEHASEKPEYNTAKQFLLDFHTQDIKTQYPHATDAQIKQHLKQQEYAEAGNAVRAGQDPLQHIEFLAFQAGYRPGTTEEEAPKAPAKQKSNIQNIKKNAKKNASLIGGSSASNTGDGLTSDQMLNMTIEQINKYGRKNFEDQIKKISTRQN